MTEQNVRDIVTATIREVMEYREVVLKESFDACYKNVKLLMRNYRKLKCYREKISEDVIKVESIGSMYQKTILMMKHIDKMLIAYKAVCEKSNSIEQQRRWQSLYFRYIDERKMSVEDIANELNIDKRTLYRDIAKALEELSILLFGVEAIKAW